MSIVHRSASSTQTDSFPLSARCSLRLCAAVCSLLQSLPPSATPCLPILFFPHRPRPLVRVWQSASACVRSLAPARRPVLWSLLALLAAAGSFLALVLTLAQHSAANTHTQSAIRPDTHASLNSTGTSLLDLSMSAPSGSGVPNLGAGVAAIKLDVTKISAAAKPAQADDNNIALLLELPDGKTDVLKFRPDLTVGYVKVEVAKKHGIPFDCQELELNGKAMADPFSLSDYPALKVSRASDPVRVVLRRVVPSDGEGEEADMPDDGNAAKGGDSDYDDESFDE